MEKEKSTIYEEVNAVLNRLLESSPERKLPLDTVLLGTEHIIDSITVMQLVAWCEEHYDIDLLDGDIELEALQTLGTLIQKIFVCIEKKRKSYEEIQ